MICPFAKHRNYQLVHATRINRNAKALLDNEEPKRGTKEKVSLAAG